MVNTGHLVLRRYQKYLQHRTAFLWNDPIKKYRKTQCQFHDRNGSGLRYEMYMLSANKNDGLGAA